MVVVARPRMGYREGLTALRRAQKPARGSSLYSLYVNRPLGRVLAAAAARFGFRPNEVTVASGSCSLAAVVLVAALRPTVVVGLASGVLLILGFALDASDGQLARLTGLTSPSGEWLDHMVDCAKIVLLHVAVVLSFFRYERGTGDWLLLVPLGMLLVSVLMFFGGNLAHQLIRGPGRAAPPPEAATTLKAVALLPADSGTMCWAFLFFGFTHVFIVIYTALFAATAIICAMLLVKWTRQIAEIPL